MKQGRGRNRGDGRRRKNKGWFFCFTGLSGETRDRTEEVKGLRKLRVLAYDLVLILTTWFIPPKLVLINQLDLAYFSLEIC